MLEPAVSGLGSAPADEDVGMHADYHGAFGTLRSRYSVLCQSTSLSFHVHWKMEVGMVEVGQTWQHAGNKHLLVMSRLLAERSMPHDYIALIIMAV
jgi:hypothetical protein